MMSWFAVDIDSCCSVNVTLAESRDKKNDPLDWLKLSVKDIYLKTFI